MTTTNKIYKVVVTETAHHKLIEHAAFLANVNKRAASRLIDDFEQAAESLEELPQRGNWLDLEGMAKNRFKKLIFAKRYIIIYSIIEETVIINYVADTREVYLSKFEILAQSEKILEDMAPLDWGAPVGKEVW